MIEFVLEYGLGLVIGLVALAIPLRRFASGPAVGWDLLGALWAHVAAAGLLVPLDVMVDWSMTHVEGWYRLTEDLSIWLTLPGYIVLADFAAYWAHRLLHTGRLWHAHAWHHSPQHLNWLAGLRATPVHILVFLLPYVVAFVLFPFEEAAAIGIALAILETLNQHLIHSNVRIPGAACIERILVTPRYHFVHHNSRAELSNSNYGFIFSVWDRLFGTHVDPATVPLDAALGLDYEISRWRLLLGIGPAHS
jgi:sterol desaturase/sphingolipid hydroxylase (fatty acid hydroxylase superfamily)